MGRRGLTHAQADMLRQAQRVLGVSIVELGKVPGWGNTLASLVDLGLVVRHRSRVYAIPGATRRRR
jgi:hypothetical protein